LPGVALADEPFSKTEKTPISDQPAISAAEIQDYITELVAKYKGEELIQKLTEYFLLSVIELVFVNDTNPTRLQRLPEDKIEIVKNLTTGLATSGSEEHPQ
jgi:hypothetical protein